jgi:hypothetical protein
MSLATGRDTRLAGLIAARKVVAYERQHWNPNRSRFGRRSSDAVVQNTADACKKIMGALDLLIQVEWKKTHKGGKKP